MQFHQCGICSRVSDADRPCHYCGAVFISCVGRYYNVLSGRQMVRGIRRVLPNLEKVTAPCRATVTQMAMRLTKGMN